MPRTLITGISGFTGWHLQRELQAAGHDVFGITYAGDTSNEKTFACDLCDATNLREAVERVQPEYVVHLAAIAFVAHDDVEAMYRTNVLGTRNLLAALAGLSQSPNAVLLASSANVYGNATAGIIDETVAPAPENDYAVSKLAMEYMAALWLKKLPITFVRPFNYTGVGQSPNFLIPKIVKHLKQRAPVIELGNLDVERDFSDVRTVVNAYRRLLTSPRPVASTKQIFNICSGQGYTLRKLLDVAADIAGYTPKIHVNQAFVRPNEVKKLVGSKAALENAIGPTMNIDIKDTLRWMMEGA